MLLFLIELDEEQIYLDKQVNLDAAYECIEETFLQEDVVLHHIEGQRCFYTRNLEDDHDFECLWMVNLPFKKEPWFMYYVKDWVYMEVDEETGEIEYDECLLDDVSVRPRTPFVW